MFDASWLLFICRTVTLMIIVVKSAHKKNETGEIEEKKEEGRDI